MVFCLGRWAEAQPTPLVSNYLQNGIVINPAYSGSAGALSLSLTSRLQWQGVNDAPLTNIFSAHTPLPIRFVSTGLLVSYNKFGPQTNTDVYNNYAFRFRIKQYSISIGALLGLTAVNNIIDQTRLIDQNDAVFNQNQAIAFKTGFGVHVEHKKFYAGFSIPSIAASGASTGLDNNIFYNQQYIYGGYNWKVSDQITLKPSVYIRNLKSYGIFPDINLMGTFFDRFTTGVSYRFGNAVVGLVNLRVNKQFHVGYSYDYLLPGNSSISTVSKGSHEIFLRYDFLYLIDDISMIKFK